MDNSSNSTIFTYYTEDEILFMFGSTWALDYLNLYLYTTVAVLAFILSIFSLLVYTDREFNIPLFSYLRVYSAFNAMQGLINIFNFTYSTYRIIPWSNSYATQYFYNCILVPSANLLYYYTSMLGLVILLDRISNFNPKYRGFFVLSPYKMCLAIFVICFVTDIPFYVAFVPGLQVLHLNKTATFAIWFSATSSFGTTTAGQVLIITLEVGRDMLVLIAELLMNAASVYMFKAYMNKKRLVQRISVGKGEVAGSRLSSSDQRATFMAILMSLTSAIVHFVVFLANVYPFFALNFYVFLFYFMCDFSLPLKCCVDFFLFFFFNKNFKRVCLKYMRLDRLLVDRSISTHITHHQSKGPGQSVMPKTMPM
jgi:hypothetical protein